MISATCLFLDIFHYAVGRTSWMRGMILANTWWVVFFDGCFSWHWSWMQITLLTCHDIFILLYEDYMIWPHIICETKKNQACLVYLSPFLCRKAHGPRREAGCIQFGGLSFGSDFLSLLLTVRHGNLLEPGRSSKLGILIWSRNASKILSTYCPYCTSQLVFF